LRYSAPYHWQSSAIDTDDLLKSRANLVIAILAAAILALIAFKSLTRQPAQMAPKPTAEKCTPEAIKQVTDALERSILSANCAKQEKFRQK
jgi:entry exclusion lipoprotein TrbK